MSTDTTSPTPLPSPSPPTTPVVHSAHYVGSVRILSINDVYAANSVDGSGGWPMLSTLIQQYRTENSIFCINGDFLGGSALAEHHQGKNVIQIMNQLGTDLVVIGNHVSINNKILELDKGQTLHKEFDYGPTALKARMLESNFHWLGSNVREKRNSTDTEDSLFEHVTNLHQIQIQLQQVDEPVSELTMKTRHSVTPKPDGNAPITYPSHTLASIGLFGLCTPHTPQLSWPGPSVSFLPVDPVVELCVSKLKGHSPIESDEISFTILPRILGVKESNHQNASSSTFASSFTATSTSTTSSSSSSSSFLPSDAIVAVTHLSLIEDSRLAREHGSNIQVLLGGHDHDPITRMENNTLIFKAGQNALWLGIIDLRIEVTLTKDLTSGHLSRSVIVVPSWSLIANRGVKPDLTISRMIDDSITAMDIAQASEEDPNEIICEIGPPLAFPPGLSLTPELQQSLLVTKTSAVRKSSSSFADLVADAMAFHYLDQGCQGGIINGGFIRGDRVYAQNTKLTLRDIRYELPFPKVAVLVRIRGAGILKALNEMLQPHPSPSGSYPHVSHQFQVEFDSKAVNTANKVLNVKHNGVPLDLDAEYRISMTTFMASGGDGISAFPTYGTIISTDQLKVSDLTLKYLRRLQILHPNIIPRVIEK